MDLNELLHSRIKYLKDPRQCSKEEYPTRKNANFEEQWNRVDEQTNAVFKDSEALRGFLDFIAGCTPQRVANLLLRYQQNAEITQPRSFEGWRKYGCSVLDEVGYTAFFEQVYERKYSRQASRYTAKKLLDASQTEGGQSPAPVTPEPQKMVAVAIASSSVRLEFSDQLPDQVEAQYVSKAKTIYVRNGMDAVSTFCAIVREQACASFDAYSGFCRAEYLPVGYCVAYVTAKWYGLDVSGFDLSPAVNACAGLEACYKREFIEDINTAADSILTNLDRILYAHENEQQNQIKSREKRQERER